jgi:hypothetical protein
VDIDNDGDVDVFIGEGNGNINFYQNTTPLPVELLSLTASLAGTQARLEWTTASELNNMGFEVQRSMDGDNWNALGFVDGKGTTLEKQAYQFTDAQPSNGVNYYRLRQIDTDGASHISARVEVVVGTIGVSFGVYPNPATDGQISVQLSGLSAAQAALVVLDPAGRQVCSMNLDTQASGAFHLNLSALPKGIYTAVLTAEGKRYTEKISLQ